MKKIFRAAIPGAIIVFCCGCRADTPVLGQFTDIAMGTVIRQSLYAAEEETGRVFSEEVMELITEIEQQRISWRLETSEVYRLNASAGAAEGCLLSEELAEILLRCVEITDSCAKLTEDSAASEEGSSELGKDSAASPEIGAVLSQYPTGAFDVTIGPVARLWDIDSWAAGLGTGDFQPPSTEALEQALSLCGSGKLGFMPESIDGAGDGAGIRLFLPAGMQIDLGAVGKGIALSEIQVLLEAQSDITGAVISAGGSILTYGTKPDKSSWKVGIVNPFDTASNIGVLSLEGQWCVSTSGDYERYVEAGGVRYHHIINPQTGYPADSGVRSVTILSKDGLLGDALSTACFVLGPEKGMELAEQYEAEALFVLSDGEIHMTDGMEKYFTGKVPDGGHAD